MTQSMTWPARIPFHLLCLAAVAGTAIGCENLVDPPETVLGAQQSLGEVALPGAAFEDGAVQREYYCTVSRRAAGLQSDGPTYEYGLIRLVIPEASYRNADGQRNRFLVYVRDQDIVEWAAWCDVPRSEDVMTRVMARLGLQGQVASGNAAGHEAYASNEFIAFSEPVRDERCPWEDSYWSEEYQSCVINLPGVGGGGSPTTTAASGVG